MTMVKRPGAGGQHTKCRWSLGHSISFGRCQHLSVGLLQIREQLHFRDHENSISGIGIISVLVRGAVLQRNPGRSGIVECRRSRWQCTLRERCCTSKSRGGPLEELRAARRRRLGLGRAGAHERGGDSGGRQGHQGGLRRRGPGGGAVALRAADGHAGTFSRCLVTHLVSTFAIIALLRVAEGSARMRLLQCERLVVARAACVARGARGAGRRRESRHEVLELHSEGLCVHKHPGAGTCVELPSQCVRSLQKAALEQECGQGIDRADIDCSRRVSHHRLEVYSGRVPGTRGS
mmetsp:Transcript_49500/g.125768  ORF Transcript_49500/g.125768 Transcript_49500/m.125768 type:complete len:292 (-) Transcript_49500:8-883(-)